MPYSISYLKGFLNKAFPSFKVKCVDLNVRFHKKHFPELYTKCKDPSAQTIEGFGTILNELTKCSKKAMVENNQKVVHNEDPILFDEILQAILDEKPDAVGMSFVYNSQCFYGRRLIEALEKKNIPCFMGGPAVQMKMVSSFTLLGDEDQILTYLSDKATLAKPEVPSPDEINPDFSDFNDEEYLTHTPIIPLKTSNTCFYKQCTFCTHFAKVPYKETALENIKKTIVQNKAKHIFFIDDMIATPRLLEIAEMLKPLNVKWWCQLRPTKDLLGKLQTLYDAGLRSVCWGVESGNQSLLDAMKKGTIVEDVQKVLVESHATGILNVAYIMFGFPGETKETFLETIAFLKENEENIDLVSTSTFGLQKGSKMHTKPQLFKITSINEEKRTVLDEKITYLASKDLQNKEVQKLRDKYRKTINNIDKIPRSYSAYKEQVLGFCE